MTVDLSEIEANWKKAVDAAMQEAFQAPRMTQEETGREISRQFLRFKGLTLEADNRILEKNGDLWGTYVKSRWIVNGKVFSGFEVKVNAAIQICDIKFEVKV